MFLFRCVIFVVGKTSPRPAIKHSIFILVQSQNYNIQQLMINLIDQIDFSKDLVQEPELASYMKEAAKFYQKQESDQLQKYKKPLFDENLENHLLVTNIPDITGKEQKFLDLFKVFLEKKGIGAKDGLQTIEPGFTQNQGVRKYNKTLYMIFKNPAIAKKAYQKLHQLKFDKEHTLFCFTVKQFKQVQKLSKEYRQPSIVGQKQLISYNIDQKHRDQFLYTVKQGNTYKLSIKWLDHLQKKIDQVIPQSALTLSGNSISYVGYSTRGSYIAVCQPEGVRLLYGQSLKEKAFFRHGGVTEVLFSPKESFLITHNKSINVTSTHHNQQSFILWAVEAQIKIQQYKSQPHQFLDSFQFNDDETKISIVSNNQLIILACDSIESIKKQLKLSQEQLQKQSKLIKAPNIQKTIWHPDGVSVTCICYDPNPSINTHPSTRIFSYNTQTREEKKWRAIGQHITKVKTAISQQGDWIAVSFKRFQKKNQSSSVVYIVNLQKRDVETEVVQFKQNVVCIGWDKNNARFAATYQIPAIRNDDIKFGVAFYQIQIKDKIQQAIKFAQISQTPTNRIILSQNGAFFAMYNIQTYSWGKYKYTLGAFLKDPKTKKMGIQIIKQNAQIPYMTYFDMDASGRFLLTGTDKTYQVWTTSGEMINKDMFNTQIKFVQFRPRYLTKLSKQGESKLQQREKQIKKKYQQQDEKRLNALQYQRKKQKQDKKNFFKKYLEEKKLWFAQFKEKRAQIRGFSQQDPQTKSTTYAHRYYQRTAN